MSSEVGGPEDTGAAPNNALLRPSDYRTLVGAYNQFKTENQILRVDFDRIFNGYKQIQTVHAELLLDQTWELREFLLNTVYISTIHPDVRDDVVASLDIVERQKRLKGAIE